MELEKIEEILKHSFVISIITKIELLGWKKHTLVGFIKASQFLRRATIISIKDELADQTIELRRKANIRLADALIAATAISNNLILVTRNEEDFSMLE